jgi:hypothetical protein
MARISLNFCSVAVPVGAAIGVYHGFIVFRDALNN